MLENVLACVWFTVNYEKWKIVNNYSEIMLSSIPYHSTAWDLFLLKFWLTLLLKARWGQVYQFEIWHNWQLIKRFLCVTYDYWQNKVENEPSPTSHDCTVARSCKVHFYLQGSEYGFKGTISSQASQIKDIYRMYIYYWRNQNFQSTQRPVIPHITSATCLKWLWSVEL